MAKTINRAIKLAGEDRVVGTPAMTVLEYNVDGNVRRCEGLTVPTDDDAGFAPGASFIDTDASATAVLYINEGTAAACDFNVINPAASSGASVALDNLDTVQINADLLFDTDNTYDIGTSTAAGKDAYFEGAVYTDVVSEINAGVGVTIDSVLLKDGQIDLIDDKKLILGTGDDGEIYVSSDHLNIKNATQDMDIILTIDDGGVGKTITWDASADQLLHSNGTFDFADDHLTTTGNVSGAVATFSSTLAAGATTIVGNTSITGDLAVSGDFSFGGDLTIGGTVTVDELILDTDGTAPGATNCYVVRDNTGDLTLNAVTGKNIELAIAGADEYSFDAAKLDFNGNAIDNAGYVILNAATQPAGTEVHLCNDNTGDLTLNAVTGKTINFAINKVDEISIAANLLQITAGSDIKFMDDGAILDSNGNEVIMVEATGSAINYLQVKNAATANPISLACLGTADKGFLFENDQDEVIVAMTPIASADTYLDFLNAVASTPIIKVQGTADTGLVIHNAAGEPCLSTSSTSAPTVYLNIGPGNTGAPATVSTVGEDDIGINFNAVGAEEMLQLAATASGTNNIKITNNANASGPTLETVGSSDASVQLNILTKGDLGVNISAGTAGDAARPALYFEGDINSGIFGASDVLGISNAGVVTATFDADNNVCVGNITGGDGTAQGCLYIGNTDAAGATAPAGATADSIVLYVEDVGGAGQAELRVIDELANDTVLSPHGKDGDYVIDSYSGPKGRAFYCELEKMLVKLSVIHPELEKFITHPKEKKHRA